jgi:lysophospholipase L1-like esterase
MIGTPLILIGVVVAALGIRLALERRRPINLVGMLLAPSGLLVALLGAGRLLSPAFFGGASPGGGGAGALRIMPAGDAITRGSPGGGSNAGDGGYRAPLWALLAQAKAPVDFVGATRSGPFSIDRDHESWTGLSIEALARRLLVDVPAQRPEVILLHIGTQDLIAGAGPEAIERRLAALIDGVASRAPEARLLVGSLLGVRVPNRFQIHPEVVAAVNRRIRALVTQRASSGIRCELVDIGARAALGPADFQEDGVHPSARGDTRIAAAWFQALRPYLPRR